MSIRHSLFVQTPETGKSLHWEEDLFAPDEPEPHRGPEMGRGAAGARRQRGEEEREREFTGAEDKNKVKT